MTTYPRTVKPNEVVNQMFGEGLFRLKGGRALYDEVYMFDGGQAVYLCRLEQVKVNGQWRFKVAKRRIPWDAEIEMMYDPTK